MKLHLSVFLRHAGRWLWLLAALPLATQSATSDPWALSPVGETKPFHGTLRARDPQLGTLSLGSKTQISRVLAVDVHSRLIKGIRPATLAEFTIGDLIDGYAFPDQHGRMVVAVATATARPLIGDDIKPKKAPNRGRQQRSAGSRRRAGHDAARSPTVGHSPSAAIQAPPKPAPKKAPKANPSRPGARPLR